jgi:RelB Antitoxin alpha helical domain
MSAEQYPFAQELITDVSGQIRKVILDFNDYKRMLEMIEDEGLYRAMMEVKNETSLDLEAALAELDKE